MRPRFNTILRTVLTGSRWGMAPFCLGLVAALLLVLAQFFRELVHLVAVFADLEGPDVILAVLKLVDLVLIANLVVMLIGAGVELFLPQPPETPAGGFAVVDFSALKLKVFASISAISAIHLLESLLNIDAVDKSGVLWEIVILLGFAVSGLLLAGMDRLAADRH